MKSLLLVVIAAFGFCVLTTGCGESTPSAPVKGVADPNADDPGGTTPKPADSNKKKGRIPKAP